MKKLYRIAAGVSCAAAALLAPSQGHAVGWPANYEGVMLQGFYWDSYDDTKWPVLESKADEYARYFSLIWVPNSGKPSNNPSMGYDPVYWFTNHNSSFGTEAQLRSMIKTYKEKGVGIIEDVVINHRNGATNWTDFPAENWNGKSYKIGTDGICSTDEVRNAPGQAKPTGAPDTGEDFNGCRDLDHTNPNVQDNCKNYCKFLLEDLGYAGFRYDMVKGYGAQYTKMYNQYSKPKFSVGEYWDGSYDAVKAWIDGTGQESAAFDFPCKYQINKCFNGGAHNYNELAWKANGTTDQPAGMIHFGYAQLAVTFVDNHDTYRDGSKMTGDVLQANAFILSSPGTPCVFLSHYKQYPTQIQAMINARNGVGLHNCSPVTVHEVNSNCYVAEATGSKGKLWLKLGNSSRTPGNGYTKKASGNGYEIWTTAEGGETPNPNPNPTPSTAPAHLYILGNVDGNDWNPAAGIEMTKRGDVFTATNLEFVAGQNETKCFFNLTDACGADWDALNGAANRYGAAAEGAAITVGRPAEMTLYANNVNASGCQSWSVEPGTYDMKVDFAKMTVTLTNSGEEPIPVDKPAHLYILGNVDGNDWTPSTAIELTEAGNSFKAENLKFVAAAGESYCFFNLSDARGADWDALNAVANRYGAAEEGATITSGVPATMTLYANNVNASGCKSWKVIPGTYDLDANFADMTVTLTPHAAGIDSVDADTTHDVPVYYNLQGQRVENPVSGVYIRVTSGSVTKVIL